MGRGTAPSKHLPADGIAAAFYSRRLRHVPLTTLPSRYQFGWAFETGWRPGMAHSSDRGNAPICRLSEVNPYSSPAHGPGVQSRSAFPSSSGNRAMLTAMRLASSPVSCLACGASSSFPAHGGRRAPAQWRPARHSRQQSYRRARVRGNGGMSSGTRRPAVIWPPPHRRDRQWISLPRIDPARRCSPAWPLQGVRPAATVRHDVLIKRSGFDWIPTKVSRRSHYASYSTMMAGVPPRRASIQDRRWNWHLRGLCRRLEALGDLRWRAAR
jgi:hypothetical protein